MAEVGHRSPDGPDRAHPKPAALIRLDRLDLDHLHRVDPSARAAALLHLECVPLLQVDLAQNLAGPLLHAKAKRVGTTRKQGKPVATVESSKWVGPVKSPISGEVVEVNPELEKDATIVNRSPYTNGWIVRMQPANLDAELPALVTGQAAVDAYRERIEAEDLKACEHVEGFED